MKQITQKDIPPSLPSEHFSDGGKHDLCSYV
jgi:hypothetical protein